jgi:hypothetical protein
VADPEKIIKNGKYSKKCFSATTKTASSYLLDFTLNTPIVLSSKLPLFSSPNIEKCFSLDSFEYFPTLGFSTSLSVKILVSQEVGDSYPSQTLPSSSKAPSVVVKTKIFALSFSLSPNLHATKSLSLACSPRIQNQMEVVNPPANRMDAIVAARYAPPVLPQLMNAFPPGDYLKYMPKFTREEDITIEEHLVSFYSYADNQNIENEYVWMRVFIQSLFGEARKWFMCLALGSIMGIEALDEALLRHWGDKKDFLYYITEFGSLKRKEGESISEFSKRFNKMYKNIPDEIKPTEAMEKISYASSFDSEFCLLLRERRSSSLVHMQDVSLEVESNIISSDKLRGKPDRDRMKNRGESSTSNTLVVHSHVDELTALVKFLSTKIEKLKSKGRHPYRNAQNTENRGNFLRSNNSAQILPRDPRNRERDDQRIQAPF